MKKLITLMLAVMLALLAVVPAFAQDEEMADNPYDAITAEELEGATIDFWYQHSRFREVQLQAMIAVFNNPDVALDDFLATVDAEVEEAEQERLGEIIENLRDVARTYNPYGIQVNGSYQGGYGDIFNKMTLGLVAGGEDLPQIVVAYQNQSATYQIDNGLVDMTPLVTSDSYGLPAEDVTDFFTGFYNADIFPTFGGARLGFPPNRSMEVMYYNVDWLAELADAGAISFEGPPTTPDQFREAACAASANPFSGAASDVEPIGYQLSVDASRFASWTFGFGGDIFDYEANQYSLNSEAAVEAMSFLQGLFEDGCAREITERFGDQADFGAGTTLFTVGSSSGLPFYQSAVEGAYETVDAEPFEWSVSAVPHVTEEPVQNIYGASVSVVRSTPVQELASWIFIKYYTSPEAQAEWAQASNYFPVRQSVADGLQGYFEANPAYEKAFDLLEYGTTEPPVPGYDTIRDDIGQSMAFIVEDTGLDPIDELTALNDAANDELADLLADIEDN